MNMAFFLQIQIIFQPKGTETDVSEVQGSVSVRPLVGQQLHAPNAPRALGSTGPKGCKERSMNK